MGTTLLARGAIQVLAFEPNRESEVKAGASARWLVHVLLTFAVAVIFHNNLRTLLMLY